MNAPIYGRVVDAHGDPVPDARVALGAGPVPVPDIAVLTGSDGGFWFDAPVPGAYLVNAYSDDGSAQAQVVAPAAEPVELRLR